MTSISPSNDILDSRDIEERIEELEEERQALVDALEEAEDALSDAPSEDLENAVDLARRALAEWDAGSEADELSDWKALRDEVSSDEWNDGLTLINRDYWVEYVEELVKDIGDMPRDIPAYIEIDWEATADNIEADYGSVTIDGQEFLYRL